MNFSLLLLIVNSLSFLLDQKIIIGIGHPLIILKKTSTSELLYSWWILLTEIYVLLLLVSGILQKSVWPNVIW